MCARSPLRILIERGNIDRSELLLITRRFMNIASKLSPRCHGGRLVCKSFVPVIGFFDRFLV